MRGRGIIIAFKMVFLGLALVSCGGFRPGIPMEAIPKDAPVEVGAKIRELYSFQAARRADAVVALGDMGEEAVAAVPFLIEMLGDDTPLAKLRDEELGMDSFISSESALSLGKIGDPRAVEPLIDEIKDKYEIDRDFKAEAIVMMGERAVDRLIALLDDDNHLTRMYSARILGEIGDVKSTKPLITALSDEYFSVRLEAVTSLGRLKDPRAVEPVIKLLDDRYERVRDKAAWALGEIGDSYALEALLVRLDFSGSMVDDSIVKALKKFGKDTAEPLIIIVSRERNQKATGWRLKENAVKLLGRLCTHSSEKAKKAAENETVREMATPPIVNALNDGDVNVRMNAVSALGAMKAKEAVEPLIAMLKGGDPSSRAAAALSLGKIKDVRAVEPLIAALTDDDEKVRDNSMWALGRITGENFRYDVEEWLKWLVEKRKAMP